MAKGRIAHPLALPYLNQSKTYTHIPQHPISATLHPPGQCFMGVKLLIGTPCMQNEVDLKKWYGLFENAWFPWQPIANLRMGFAYKITHISAITYPRLLNLIPN